MNTFVLIFLLFSEMLPAYGESAASIDHRPESVSYTLASMYIATSPLQHIVSFFGCLLSVPALVPFVHSVPTLIPFAQCPSTDSHCSQCVLALIPFAQCPSTDCLCS